MAIGNNINIKFENNTGDVRADMKAKKIKIAYAIGLKWLEICTKVITSIGIVDTGRLRASLSFITSKQSSGLNSFAATAADSKGNDALSGGAEEDTIIVGSNVSYAAKQELSNKKGSFIRPSLLDYKEDYESIAKAILKE